MWNKHYQMFMRHVFIMTYWTEFYFRLVSTSISIIMIPISSSSCEKIITLSSDTYFCRCISMDMHFLCLVTLSLVLGTRLCDISDWCGILMLLVFLLKLPKIMYFLDIIAPWISWTSWTWPVGGFNIIQTIFYRCRIPVIKMRQSWNHHIFIWGISLLIKHALLCFVVIWQNLFISFQVTYLALGQSCDPNTSEVTLKNKGQSPTWIQWLVVMIPYNKEKQTRTFYGIYHFNYNGFRTGGWFTVK